MKKVIIGFGALMLFGISMQGWADFKVGIIDLNKLFVSIPQIKDMQTDLKKKFEGRGQELDKMQNLFKGDFTKYQQSKGKLKNEDLKKEQQKVLEEGKKLQATRVSFQQDLVNARNQELRPVLDKINVVVGKIATTQKFDMVLTRVATAYYSPQYDITDQVIAEMKKGPVATVPKK